MKINEDSWAHDLDAMAEEEKIRKATSSKSISPLRVILVAFLVFLCVWMFYLGWSYGVSVTH